MLAYQAEECWEGLLLCEISGSAEDDDDGVFLEFNGPITSINQHVDQGASKA
jgi:hypothetical protein